MSTALSRQHVQTMASPYLMDICQVRQNPAKSSGRSNNEAVPYGRGEGLVDSPRHPETGVFLPILPHSSAAIRLWRHGAQRRVLRGYIRTPMRPVAPFIGGGRYGA